MKNWLLIILVLIAASVSLQKIVCSNSTDLSPFQNLPDELVMEVGVRLFNLVGAEISSKISEVMTYEEFAEFSKSVKDKENLFLTCNKFHKCRFNNAGMILSKLNVDLTIRFLFKPFTNILSLQKYTALGNDFTQCVTLCRNYLIDPSGEIGNACFLKEILENREKIPLILAKSHNLIVSVFHYEQKVKFYTVVEWFFRVTKCEFSRVTTCPAVEILKKLYPNFFPSLEILLNSQDVNLRLPLLGNPEKNLAQYVHKELIQFNSITGSPNIFSELEKKTQEKVEEAINGIPQEEEIEEVDNKSFIASIVESLRERETNAIPQQPQLEIVNAQTEEVVKKNLEDTAQPKRISATTRQIFKWFIILLIPIISYYVLSYIIFQLRTHVNSYTKMRPY
jgi:hypothetical protein